MSRQVGTVASLWRYPVKSMRGEELEEVFVGNGGIAGDRLFAFRSSLARPDFPYFTARQQERMLHFRPRSRASEDPASPNEWSVESPTGEVFALDGPALREALRAGADPRHELSLMRSDRALADTFPISIFSHQTAEKLSEEIGRMIDPRRFRANFYLDLPATDGFAEDEFVGRALRIGPTAVVAIRKRDIRCMMINIDPDTLATDPAILKHIAQAHDAAAGVYGAVSVEGMVRKGDAVELLD